MEHNNKFQISYNPLRCRVKISFTSGECMSPSFNVEEIIQKATARIKKEKEHGTICDYIVFANGFKRFIQAVRDDIRRGGNTTAKLDFVLAGGAVNIPNFSLETSNVEEVSFYLNLKNSPVLRKMTYDLFKISLLCSLKNTPIIRPNMAQVQSAFLRVSQTNEECERLPIGTLPYLKDNKSLYKIFTNKKRREIILMINKKDVFYAQNSVDMFKAVYSSVIFFSKQLQRKIFLYKQELIEEFERLSTGRRRYGIDLPVTILVGSDRPSDYQEDIFQPVKQKIKEPYKIKDEDWGPIRLKISDQSMEASIIDFDMNLYNTMELTKDWFIQELARLNITNGVQEDYLNKIAEAIEKKESLNGFVVATGQLGEAPSEPYLIPAFEISSSNTSNEKKESDSENESVDTSDTSNGSDNSDQSSSSLEDSQGLLQNNSPIDNIKQENPSSSLSSGSVDLRKLQQRQIVHENDRVAQIAYKYPATCSMNIFSEQIPINAPLIPEGITIGENFKVINGGYVIALKNGLVCFDDERKSIKLSEVYVYKGDINLQSGDVIFDGDVQIEGSVDEGSTVISTGNITITGSVTKATIKAKGSLTVTYGIITGDDAVVQVGGDINADFIQYSTIYCRGSLNISKSIISSKVYVGKNITLDENSGIIAGGEIICGHRIVTNKVGSEGSGSRIKVGVDWKTLQAVNIRTERLKRYIRLFKEQEAIYKDLSTRYANQKTQNHIQLEQKLKKQIPRYNDLLTKMKAHLEKAKQKLLFNYDASIKITGDLLANNTFEVCDIVIPVTYSLNAVTIDSRKIQGSYIHKMHEPKEQASDSKATHSEVQVDSSSKKEDSSTAQDMIETSDSSSSEEPPQKQEQESVQEPVQEPVQEQEPSPEQNTSIPQSESKEQNSDDKKEEQVSEDKKSA